MEVLEGVPPPVLSNPAVKILFPTFDVCVSVTRGDVGADWSLIFFQWTPSVITHESAACEYIKSVCEKIYTNLEFPQISVVALFKANGEDVSTNGGEESISLLCRSTSANLQLKYFVSNF